MGARQQTLAGAAVLALAGADVVSRAQAHPAGQLLVAGKVQVRGGADFAQPRLRHDVAETREGLEQVRRAPPACGPGRDPARGWTAWRAAGAPLKDEEKVVTGQAPDSLRQPQTAPDTATGIPRQRFTDHPSGAMTWFFLHRHRNFGVYLGNPDPSEPAGGSTGAGGRITGRRTRPSALVTRRVG